MVNIFGVFWFLLSLATVLAGFVSLANMGNSHFRTDALLQLSLASVPAVAGLYFGFRNGFGGGDLVWISRKNNTLWRLVVGSWFISLLVVVFGSRRNEFEFWDLFAGWLVATVICFVVVEGTQRGAANLVLMVVATAQSGLVLAAFTFVYVVGIGKNAGSTFGWDQTAYLFGANAVANAVWYGLFSKYKTQSQ
jgi:hypothetical protein